MADLKELCEHFIANRHKIAAARIIVPRHDDLTVLVDSNKNVNSDDDFFDVKVISMNDVDKHILWSFCQKICSTEITQSTIKQCMKGVYKNFKCIFIYIIGAHPNLSMS